MSSKLITELNLLFRFRHCGYSYPALAALRVHFIMSDSEEVFWKSGLTIDSLILSTAVCVTECEWQGGFLFLNLVFMFFYKSKTTVFAQIKFFMFFYLFTNLFKLLKRLYFFVKLIGIMLLVHFFVD